MTRLSTILRQCKTCILVKHTLAQTSAKHGADNLPIGFGVTEAACNSVVKQRSPVRKYYENQDGQK
jgi:hypothetical protein